MRATLAAIRFGTGLSPEIAPPRDAEDLLRSIRSPDDVARAFPVEGWVSRFATLRDWGRLRRARRDDDAAQEAFRHVNRQVTGGYHTDLKNAVLRGATTRAGFRERLHWFWVSHFAVSDGNGHLRRNVASYHEEALRPNLAGRFADLLTAAVTHPAMLVYLDQAGSIGPNSVRGRRGGGLNENLAREVLELHTLGADGGYTQRDVHQLAALLTGLSLAKDGSTVFQRNLVEPGAEVVLSRRYGGDTPNRHDIAAVLADLSVHPRTARHLSFKLARHFVADVPDAALVQAMTEAWTRSDGDLAQVYAAMLDHPAAWSPVLRKARQPLDMVVATMRATGAARQLRAARIGTVRRTLTQPMARMGQPWLRPPGPDGWPEEAEAWVTPQGLAARLDWIADLVGRLDEPPDPRAFVDTALGPLAGPRTRFAAEAAEDRLAGLGLVLASPAFQRR